MDNEKKIGVGVVGLGFMGATHVRAYSGAAEAGLPCELVAVCDRNEARRRGEPSDAGNIGGGSAELLFDPETVTGYSDYDEMLGDEQVSLVSVCTHTDLHVEMAARALAAGKHVLVEKPVAVDAAAVHRLASEAERANRDHGVLCMPAMCIRHWPAYAWAKEAVADGRFGTVRSAVFHRLASPPAWSGDFYTDSARSGGALADLHIHDADFVFHLLGKPSAVSSVGSLDHVTTLYRYEGGPAHVVAEGGWDHTAGFAFRMRFVIVLERATLDFDGQQLLVCQGGGAEAVELPAETGWDMQVRALVSAIAGGEKSPPTTMADAAFVADLLEAERASMEARLPIELA